MTAKYEYPDKFVSKLGDIPKTPHWAIVECHTCTDSGDAAYSHDYVKYEVYLTEEKWKEQIQYREENKSKYGRDEYRALRVAPAEISIKTEVKVDVNF